MIWAAIIVKNDNLPASDLIFFSTFLFLILEPIILLSWIGIVASQGYAAWTRIKELILSLSEPLEESWMKGQSLESLHLPLWDNLIDLKIKPSRWTIFIGETGCGKSWCLEKLALLFSHQNISYSLIQQEPYLYNDTIESNIFLGLEPTTEKIQLAKEYLHKFGLTVLDDDLDKLLAMELGENGKRVSGGQAKRISLIRSLVADVDFIIWDDPFSSIDLILESEILREIKTDPRLENKTFILTSHRLSTVRLCDDVIFIDKKAGLKEYGETKDLLNSNSQVRAFFEKQNS